MSPTWQRFTSADCKGLVSVTLRHWRSIARLIGDEDYSLRILDHLDVSLSPDLAIQAMRERARLAVDANRRGEAAEFYQRCLDLARASDYAYLERSVSIELTDGPPALRTDRAPIGQWDPRSMENVPEQHRPYAVVIRLPVRSESAVLELENRIASLLRDDPGLGYVDGVGGDGEIWEIFLEGEDAAALWRAVGPLLDSPHLWPHAEVTQRDKTGSHRFRLSAPPS